MLPPLINDTSGRAGAGRAAWRRLRREMMTAFGFWLKVGRPVLRSVGRAEDDGREGGRNSIIDFDILFEGAMAWKEGGREGSTVRDGEGKGGVGERGGTANNISSSPSFYIILTNIAVCWMGNGGRSGPLSTFCLRGSPLQLQPPVG